jgi:hypothetical protein
LYIETQCPGLLDIPEDAETFLEEFEEGEYDLETLKGHKFGPTSAAWLADAIQTKSDEFYERREEEMERRLAVSTPDISECTR